MRTSLTVLRKLLPVRTRAERASDERRVALLREKIRYLQIMDIAGAVVPGLERLRRLEGVAGTAVKWRASEFVLVKGGQALPSV